MNDLKYYMSLPYSIVIRLDEQGDYVARVDELPGCTAHGKTQEEALAVLRDVMESWISDCLEAGDPIPEPEPEDELPSGKWVQRVPRSLHKKLAALAKKEKVSLNQLVASFLAEAVGLKRAAEANRSVADFHMASLGSWHESWSEQGSPIGLAMQLQMVNKWDIHESSHSVPIVSPHSYSLLRRRISSRSRVNLQVINDDKEKTTGHRD